MLNSSKDPLGIRLQKLLSEAGVASRRASERLIQDGRVSVNGRIVTELGTRANPVRDVVRVDERRVKHNQPRRYLLLNKPRGYVTTRHDPQKRQTVLDLISRVRQYVYPVGRLDYDSEGLLLLTNDGDLAAHLTHPRHIIERVYEVLISGVPSSNKLRSLSSGISIDGHLTAPAYVVLLGGQRRSVNGSDKGRDQSRVQITLREGRNRQVRRMFEVIGHEVIRLKRTRLGPLRIRGLKLGEHRELTAVEVAALKKAAVSSSLPVIKRRSRKK